MAGFGLTTEVFGFNKQSERGPADTAPKARSERCSSPATTHSSVVILNYPLSEASANLFRFLLSATFERVGFGDSTLGLLQSAQIL